MLGIEHVLVALRRRDQLRIVDGDLARIDVPDTVRVLHVGQDVAGVLQLGIVDRQGYAGVVHLEHLQRRKALDVDRTARQPTLRQHLGAALRRAGLVLHDLPAVLDQDRLLDVLVEQARIVAAPGADDDAALGLRPRRPRQGRRPAPAAAAPARNRRRSGLMMLLMRLLPSLWSNAGSCPCFFRFGQEDASRLPAPADPHAFPQRRRRPVGPVRHLHNRPSFPLRATWMSSCAPR